MARASPRKKAAVNYNESETNGRATTKEAAASKKSAPGKRKLDSAEENGAESTATKGAAKKRKTGKTKEEDAMPIAERTAISALKKPMYIGAHVSAAGGQ